MVFLTLIASLLLAATSWAAPVFERELVVPASPLQVYNALTVDWQVRQWSGAAAVASEARPGGVWRWTYSPERLHEGVFEVAERGAALTYTHILTGVETRVTIEISAAGDSARVHLRHEVSERSARAAELRGMVEQFWAEALPRLTAYWSCMPGGYIARPAGVGPHPAVLLLHDRFGVNRTMRAFCDSLAASGYVAMAADMFRGEVTGDMGQAERYVQLVKAEEAQNAARRAFLCLHNDSMVDSNRMAVWGVGFGTAAALRLAAQEPYLRGVVVWQGTDVPEAETLRRVAAPVFALFADTDNSRPREEITAFSQQLVQAGVRVETVVLAGNREFSDTAYGVGYTASAVGEGWPRTRLFLDKQLRPR
ncbi:MAG: dienelactone hydrolase family protein [bacterium]|nr:dienelactone hydrolase family protein [bacterium]